MRILAYLPLLLLALFQNAQAGTVKINVEPKFYYEAAAWLGGGGGWPTIVVEKAESMGEAFSIASQLYHDTSCHVSDRDGLTYCRDAGAPVAGSYFYNGRVSNYYSEGIPDYGSGRAAAVSITLHWECPTVFNGDTVYSVTDMERAKVDPNHEQISCVIYVPTDDACDDCDGIGNPVLPASGHKVQLEVDYPTTKSGLTFERTYRSGKKKFFSILNQGWYGAISDQGSPCYPAYWVKSKTKLDEYCYPVANNAHSWQLENGRAFMYTGEPADLAAKSAYQYTWIGTSAADEYRVRSSDNFLYTLDSRGRVTKKSSADGRVRLTYIYTGTGKPANFDSLGLLVEAKDAFGRSLKFTYDSEGQLKSMVDPALQVYSYDYSAPSRLSTVIYPDSTAKAYHYEATPQNGCTIVNGENLLTGITDEAGNRFATYKYRCDGRAASSEHAGGAYKYNFSYYSAYPNETIATDPLGTQYRYNYNLIGERYWLSWLTIASSVDRSPGPSKSFTRDAKGNVLQRNDEGRPTCFEYDPARSLRTSMTEGVPSNISCASLASGQLSLPVTARKTSYQWHPAWSLHTRVAQPKLLTTYVYNGQSDPFAGGAKHRRFAR